MALGARVYLCARSEAETAATVAELRAKGYDVVGRACDVSVREQRECLMEAVSEAFGGRLNHLVSTKNNNQMRNFAGFKGKQSHSQ